MFVLATLMGLIEQMSGTPYITGGNSPAGTDCSGLASLVSNVATDRPAFSGRFNTGNEESALLARGFHYGTAPGALVIGWNGGHTAVTLPDGTPVSSGEGGGVRIGGGGAYQNATGGQRCSGLVEELGCRLGWSGVVDVVEDVEELGAELKIEGFREVWEVRVFDEGCIPVGETWADD